MIKQKVKSYVKSSAFIVDSCVFITLLITVRPWVSGNHQFLRALVPVGIPALLVALSFKRKK